MRADGPAARRWLFAAALLAASATSLVVAVEMVTRRLMRWRPMPWLPESPVALAALPLIALAALLVAHALSRTGTRGRARLVTASVFAALFASGVAVQWQLNARLQSDGFYYFAYLRSIAFDRDVDFTNDYPLLGLSDKAYLWQPPTVTGYAHSAWTIGPAIVWAPFFGGAHLAALRQQGQGLPVATDGTSYPYRQAVCIAGLFYALLGTWFSIRAARQFFPASIAATGAALVVGGSFMLWYTLAEPSMTHAPTMAAVAAFVWYWTATMPRRSLWQWIGLGALAGFVGLVRWQSVLFALLPAIEALVALWRAGRARDAASLRATLVGGVAFTMRRGRGVHAADARLEGDLRALPGGVAGRAADRLAPSAPRRRPVRVAERPLRDVADPLRRRDRPGDLRAPEPGDRRAVAGRGRGDDLLQRVDPGLVGQRRLRRPALRRDAAAVRARRRRRDRGHQSRS